VKEYAVIVAVGELGKAVISPETVSVVGVQPEHIILKVLSDPDDFLKGLYIGSGDLSDLEPGLDELDPGLYKISFQMSDIRLGSLSMDLDNSYEEHDPTIEELKIEPTNWPVEKESKIVTTNLIDGGD